MATARINQEPESQALEFAQPTPLVMLQTAIQRGANIDTIERLVALQERMLARDAEIAFNDAMNRAQAALTPVATDLTNPQTKSRYASYAALDRVARPVYSKELLALSFDTAESPLAEHVRVVCYVSHAAGHTRHYHVDMPSDGKGAKGGDVMTKTHATGAALSYGMRYLLKMIFNIAVGEDDTDGNRPTAFADLNEHLEWIQNAKDLNELQRLFANAYKKASSLNDQNSMKRLIAAKDARRKELL